MSKFRVELSREDIEAILFDHIRKTFGVRKMGLQLSWKVGEEVVIESTEHTGRDTSWLNLEDGD